MNEKEAGVRRVREIFNKVTLILPGELYLSGQDFTKKQLAEAGIQMVVNLTGHRSAPHARGVVTTFDWPLRDSAREDILTHMPACIHAMETGEKPILVHCAAGVSRSPSIVICYLMKTLDLPWLEAAEFVLERRGCIHPNAGFLAQIRQYGKSLEEEGGGFGREN